MNAFQEDTEKQRPINAPRIGVSLPCRRCGYDLKGQILDNPCPECGVPISETLESTLDLESPRRGPLPYPQVAGSGLILMALSAVVPSFIVVLAVVVPEIKETWITANTQASLSKWMQTALTISSLVGLISVLTLLIGAGLREFRTFWYLPLAACSFIFLQVGSYQLPLIWTTSHPNPTQLFNQRFIMALIDAWPLLPLMGLALSIDPLIQTMGKRSLRFKRAGGAVQKTSPLLFTIILQIISLIIASLSSGSSGFGEEARFFAFLIFIVSTALTFIGFSYLVVNAIWASIPLFNRHHRLGQILELPEGSPPSGHSD